MLGIVKYCKYIEKKFVDFALPAYPAYLAYRQAGFRVTSGRS